jgi:DNA-binding beta-propeller fold protein YncE
MIFHFNIRHIHLDNNIVSTYDQLNEKSIILDLYWKLSDRCIVNHLTPEIYIANEYSNTISVFDTTTDKLEQP